MLGKVEGEGSSVVPWISRLRASYGEENAAMLGGAALSRWTRGVAWEGDEKESPFASRPW